MDFIVIGKVTAIVPSKYGISIKIHETQCGGRSKNGNRFGDKDNHWSCFVTNQASQRYVKANFRPGAIVKVKGTIDSNIHDTESDNVFTTYIFNLTDIDLFNMGDQSVEKNERKYNEKVVGEEKPDANNNFTNDF